jgi:hypothetical protein
VSLFGSDGAFKPDERAFAPVGGAFDPNGAGDGNEEETRADEVFDPVDLQGPIKSGTTGGVTVREVSAGGDGHRAGNEAEDEAVAANDGDDAESVVLFKPIGFVGPVVVVDAEDDGKIAGAVHEDGIGGRNGTTRGRVSVDANGAP